MSNPSNPSNPSNLILEKALSKSLNAGVAGYSAMIFQVTSMMWLRTTMNYQFKNGGTTLNTLKLLYKDGGLPRFYRGVSFALLYAPIARFGDTAANVGVMTYLEDSDLSKANKTFIGSTVAGLWRISVIPIDAFKSNLQIHGSNGMAVLKQKIAKEGYRSLYNGAKASYFATLVGHFPWFYTYNFLQEEIPKQESPILNFFRSGSIGFCSSATSDIVSNSIRIMKINKQTGNEATYKEVVQNILKKDGVVGMFTRGLKTKLLINGLQGFIFVVVFDKMKSYLNIK